MDISVTFPEPGVIRLRSCALFSEPDNATCHRFLERVFQTDEIHNVTIRRESEAQADLHFRPERFALRDVVRRVVENLSWDCPSENGVQNGSAGGLSDRASANGDGLAQPDERSSAHGRTGDGTNGFGGANGFGGVNGHAIGNGHAGPGGHATRNGQGHGCEHWERNGHPAGHRIGESGGHRQRLAPKPKGRLTAKPKSAADRRGVVRYYRHDTVITGWTIRRENPGRIKLKNPALFRKGELCQAIERELMGILGIDRYSTNSLTCAVVLDYDPRLLNRSQLIEILDGVLDNVEHPAKLDRLDLHLPICTALLPLAAAAQFAAPGSFPWPRDSLPTPRFRPSRTRGYAVCRKAAGSGRAGCDRGDRLPGNSVDLSRRGPLLVPELRPPPGQEDRRQFQKAVTERLRQAAAVRVALSRRRRSSSIARPARPGRHHRRQHR